MTVYAEALALIFLCLVFIAFLCLLLPGISYLGYLIIKVFNKVFNKNLDSLEQNILSLEKENLEHISDMLENNLCDSCKRKIYSDEKETD
jgi:predicted PurR-regulated permease PerM